MAERTALAASPARALRSAAAEVSLEFDMADERLDGGPSPELAFDDAAILAREEDAPRIGRFAYRPAEAEQPEVDLRETGRGGSWPCVPPGHGDNCQATTPIASAAMKAKRPISGARPRRLRAVERRWSPNTGGEVEPVAIDR